MASKNCPTNKKASQPTKLVLSSECEACLNQCQKGIAYINRLKAGKAGNGIVCPQKG